MCYFGLLVNHILNKRIQMIRIFIIKMGNTPGGYIVHRLLYNKELSIPMSLLVLDIYCLRSF